MKINILYLMFTALCICFTSIAQNTTQNQVLQNKLDLEIDTLTEVMLNKHHSTREKDIILSNRKHLVRYNYIYSQSFKIKEGQEYSLEDYLKIDVLKFEDVFSLTEQVEYFDEESGLFLILDSYSDANSKIGSDILEYEEVLPTYSRINQQ